LIVGEREGVFGCPSHAAFELASRRTGSIGDLSLTPDSSNARNDATLKPIGRESEKPPVASRILDCHEDPLTFDGETVALCAPRRAPPPDHVQAIRLGPKRLNGLDVHGRELFGVAGLCRSNSEANAFHATTPVTQPVLRQPWSQGWQTGRTRTVGVEPLSSGRFSLARTSMLDKTADLAKHRAASNHTSGRNPSAQCLVRKPLSLPPHQGLPVPRTTLQVLPCRECALRWRSWHRTGDHQDPACEPLISNNTSVALSPVRLLPSTEDWLSAM
jgi:hypothetical protein